jgi:hypothetical protein
MDGLAFKLEEKPAQTRSNQLEDLLIPEPPNPGKSKLIVLNRAINN